MVLKSTTEISPAKSRLFTLSVGWDPRDATVLYANQTAAGLQAILMVTLDCCVVRIIACGSNHHHAGGRHRMVDLAGTVGSPENTELSDQVV